MKIKFFLIAFIFLLALVENASATVVVINVTEDTVVAQAFPATNAGTDKELPIGTGGTGFQTRVYLNFSNLSELHGKIITDAKLNLTVNRSGSGGHVESINLYRLFNTSWSENITTWNNQPNTNNSNHTSDLFVSNSSDYTTVKYALFDVKQAIGFAAARNQTSIGFVLIRGTTTLNKLTYFNSLNNISNAQVPRLEITYEEPKNYVLNINSTNQLGNKFEMGLSYYYTNGTGDQENITQGMEDIGGNILIHAIRWDMWEPDNATPSNTSELNWTGFNWTNGREDEFYNGEWHNHTWLGFLQAAKNINPNNPPTVTIRLIVPPDWIKAAGISAGKWYPFKSDFYIDEYYAVKMALLYATQNASYPADKIIIQVVNEPYGNTDTSISTYANRLENYGEMMRAAYDAIQEINSSIGQYGLDDNDPTSGLTRDLFLQNSTLAKYFTKGITTHNYLHGDTGFNAWEVDGTRKIPCVECDWNPYNREWELLYQEYQTDVLWTILNNGSYNFPVKKVMETEFDDKYLAYNDPTGNGDIKIFNTTNDALWFAAKWGINAQQKKNASMPWTLQPVYNVNGYDVNNSIDLGWGFMDSFQNNWTKYEAYNVSKIYKSYANGSNIINISNNTLNDNYIFAAGFNEGNNTRIFLTNVRFSPSNISINVTGVGYSVNNLRVHTLFNGTKVKDVSFSDTEFNYVVQANESLLFELLDSSPSVESTNCDLKTNTGNLTVNTCNNQTFYNFTITEQISNISFNTNFDYLKWNKTIAYQIRYPNGTIIANTTNEYYQTIYYVNNTYQIVAINQGWNEIYIVSGAGIVVLGYGLWNRRKSKGWN